MARATGLSNVKRYLAQLPVDLQRKVLRGAARAGASVVVAEARERVTSAEVGGALTTKTVADGTRATSTISVKPGWARSLGIWLEYGTSPHFITVDDSQRRGMSAGRINRLDKAAEKEGRSGPGHSLKIGGSFVGDTVHHPGARPHPFLRVALDLKGSEAVAAAQSYINSRISSVGITGSDELESEDA